MAQERVRRQRVTGWGPVAKHSAMTIARQDPQFLERAGRRARAQRRRQLILNAALAAMAAVTLVLVYAALLK